MDKPEIITKLKEIQKGQSKAITREYVRKTDPKLEWAIRKNFGTFTSALEAAGISKNLNIVNPEALSDVIDNDKSKSELKKMVRDNEWLGKAAENYIVGELLYRGYNAARLTMDDGLDIIAKKDEKVFYFQVKNLTYTKTNNEIKISIDSFNRNNGGNTYYVLVVNEGENEQRSVLVLPSLEISRILKNKDLANGTKYRLRIKKDEKNKFWINGIEETYYLGNWKVIS